MRYACILLFLGCGSTTPQTPSSPDNSLSSSTDHEIVAAFDGGKTYRVRSENGTEIDTGTVNTNAVVTVVSDRKITHGGIFGQSEVAWTETITGVEITGDKEWTSQSGSPPPDELLSLAALASASYSVAITASGETSVGDLQIPMPALSDEQRVQMREKLGNVTKVAESLAGSVTASLRSLPNRRARVGDTWSNKSAKPSMGDKEATMQLDWKLARADDTAAIFEITGRYDDASLEVSRVDGSAHYDLAGRLFRDFHMTTRLKWKSGVTVTTTTRVTTEAL